MTPQHGRPSTRGLTLAVILLTAVVMAGQFYGVVRCVSGLF